MNKEDMQTVFLEVINGLHIFFVYKIPYVLVLFTKFRSGSL